MLGKDGEGTGRRLRSLLRGHGLARGWGGSRWTAEGRFEGGRKVHRKWEPTVGKLALL